MLTTSTPFTTSASVNLLATEDKVVQVATCFRQGYCSFSSGDELSSEAQTWLQVAILNTIKEMDKPTEALLPHDEFDLWVQVLPWQLARKYTFTDRQRGLDLVSSPVKYRFTLQDPGLAHLPPPSECH
ncbi:hypothetical protein BGZ73_002013 [Actinomortierella ambigua]|nr:hypothetical protein BGZ73_002013 [Actinomortierella ambigua]